MYEGRRLSGARRWAAAVLMLAAAAAAGAQESRKPTHQEQLKQFHASWTASGKPMPAATLRPKFGTNNVEIVNVHSYEFQANTTSDLINDDGNGYRYFGAEAVPYMAAPVRLPSGAHIVSIRASQCSAADGDLVFSLFDNGQGGGGGTLIAGPLLSGSGCNVTLGDADYTYATSLGHPLYVVVFFAGGQTDGSAKFNDFSVVYTRQVSPAPAQATFGDVPSSDFGFQYVEALAASGITGGCGGGDYCPDDPVTRRQMAIFLAKALGLHWPD
jgi:hypothetical protein